MFIDDLVKIMVDAGVGTFGTNIFTTTKAQLPAGPGPFLTMVETGGSGPEGTHNALVSPAYVRPNAQIMARAASSPAARTMIHAAYNAIFPIRNRLINGVWWRQVICLQEPFDLGVDAAGRVCFVFNISVTKRPNAATS